MSETSGTWHWSVTISSLSFDTAAMASTTYDEKLDSDKGKPKNAKDSEEKIAVNPSTGSIATTKEEDPEKAVAEDSKHAGRDDVEKSTSASPAVDDERKIQKGEPGQSKEPTAKKPSAASSTADEKPDSRKGTPEGNKDAASRSTTPENHPSSAPQSGSSSSEIEVRDAFTNFFEAIASWADDVTHDPKFDHKRFRQRYSRLIRTNDGKDAAALLGLSSRCQRHDWLTRLSKHDHLAISFVVARCILEDVFPPKQSPLGSTYPVGLTRRQMHFISDAEVAMVSELRRGLSLFPRTCRNFMLTSLTQIYLQSRGGEGRP